MILKALYDYYNRNQNELAPLYLSYEDFFFAIVINKEGKFLRIEDLRNDKGEGTTIMTLRPEERTSAPVPHFLGDNGSYVLGLKDVKMEDGFDYQKEYQKDKNKEKHNSFVSYINNLYNTYPDNETLKAIHAFYHKNDLCNLYNQLHNTAIWKVLSSFLNKNITFRIEGSKSLAAGDNTLFKHIINARTNENKEQICLITGKKAKPVTNTHSSFILGGQATARLVACQTDSGYDSYGKTSCLNSPISEEAEFKYTTALLYLLHKNSMNKFVINLKQNPRTFVFWASSNSEAAQKSEECLFDLFRKAENDENDDPNKRIELVQSTFMSIYNGKLPTSKDDKFYILGLAPNAARIAVIYWKELPLREFAGLITRHFEDMNIIDTRKEKKPYVGLHSMLGTITLGGKSSDATPNLPDALVKSIFQGLPYPASLFQACVRRIRAEQSINITRAAIIKAYLNRLNDNNNQKIKYMLDKDNQNQGYLCGRLFAVLDKIQEDANKIHTIRERYMNSASATPAMVFSTILNLSTHHLEKLNVGGQIMYEKLKQEIISKLDANGFPTHLDLQDQGRFFVGYYHQRQDLFTSKVDNQETEEE